MASWPDDATLDDLFEQAAHTKSGALAFDPGAPGGFRVLTDIEDQQLIDALRLPEPESAERYEAEQDGTGLVPAPREDDELGDGD